MILIPTGDPAGVGPELAVVVANERAGDARIALIGDGARLADRLLSVPVPLDAPLAHGVSVIDMGRVAPDVVEARAPTAEGGRVQLRALDRAIDEALARPGSAIVTAPTCKAAIEASGTPFIGQTERLARRAGLADDDVSMLFIGPRLRVALVTTHLALRAVPDALTEARVSRAIRHLREALCALGLTSPRIVVASLNPHAGEGGLFGDEDDRVLAPAARALGVEGPQGAETAFRRAASGDVDGVVAMYHDQATIPSKLLDWGAAVNVTWGLPFLRTSVDHGVAYDVAGTALVQPDGMRAAFDLATRLRGRRD